MTNMRANRDVLGGLERDACRALCRTLSSPSLACCRAAAPGRRRIIPNRPVKIIVPFPAGGTADAVPRLVAEWLSRKWGQPVVIENRTGAAGNIGSDMAYRAEPDGYTLLSAPPPPLVINQNLYPNLSFDPTKFEPIIVMAQVPNSIIVNPAKISAPCPNSSHI